ncbi:DUF2339 domain-containing protein [Phycicoccus sonneratiae]|uniref:DUF2339 domain-containing protein n=1 Tax=Phycicoccus sonneratiae TaxID=2807628 RepID=A0ABS2CQR2_9MICO|nr:DUF2339 domain-containing protein [Phycicoccus sonneraticus]MBM6402232.1 DUF2339 domain-containing protein [Phycicoccus sonneraticus]
MTQRDDVARLEREFADAMQRMYSVGNGLARMRAELERGAVTPMAGTTPAAAVRPSTARVPSAGPAAPPQPAGQPAAGVPVVVGAVPQGGATPATAWAGSVRGGTGPVPTGGGIGGLLPAEPTPPWYRREGAVTRVLAVSGAVVTLSGVAMLLVLAVRHGWFGPGARVTAGAFLAAVLGGLGVRGGAHERGLGSPVGSAPVALVATGAAAAYLDVVAVTAYYGWIPPVLGLVLCTAVAVAGLAVARRWRSELLAVLMVAGAGALSPVVAGEAGWLLSAVLGVLAVAGWWAGGDRSVPLLTVSRSLPVSVSLLAGAGLATGRDGRVALLVVALVVLLATLATSAVSVRRDGGDVASSAALALVLVGALAVDTAQGGTLATVAHVAVAGVLLLGATVLGRSPVGPVAPHLVVTAGVGGAVSAVLAVVSGAPDGFVGTGLLLLALAHLAVAGVTRSRISLGIGSGVAALALLAWVQHPFAVVSVDLASRHDLPVAFVDSVLAGGVVALAWWATASVRGVPTEVRLVAQVIAWVVGLASTATALVSAGTLAGERFAAPELGFTAGHAVATVTWMAAAAALLLHSLDRPGDSDLALRSGLLLSAVAVAKLFLFDLAALDGVLRSVAFIATGLLLLATGSRYARAWERSRPGT